MENCCIELTYMHVGHLKSNDCFIFVDKIKKVRFVDDRKIIIFQFVN